MSRLGHVMRAGFRRALDACAVDRLQEASRAEASVCAVLHASMSGCETQRSQAIARLAERERSVRFSEARFVCQMVLHALGTSTELPDLPSESLASHSIQWRAYRRRLRRIRTCMLRGASLTAAGSDLLSEACALLNRMRREGSWGVDWPNASFLALCEREVLCKVACEVDSEEAAVGPNRL